MVAVSWIVPEPGVKVFVPVTERDWQASVPPFVMVKVLAVPPDEVLMVKIPLTVTCEPALNIIVP